MNAAISRQLILDSLADRKEANRLLEISRQIRKEANEGYRKSRQIRAALIQEIRDACDMDGGR